MRVSARARILRFDLRGANWTACEVVILFGAGVEARRLDPWNSIRIQRSDRGFDIIGVQCR